MSEKSPESPAYIQSRGTIEGFGSVELLHHAVLDELEASNAFNALGITDSALRTLAWTVTTRISYAFEVTWSPDWVPPGRPHTWRDERGWHARCNDCLAESLASSTTDEAVAWFDDHLGRGHSE